MLCRCPASTCTTCGAHLTFVFWRRQSHFYTKVFGKSYNVIGKWAIFLQSWHRSVAAWANFQVKQWQSSDGQNGSLFIYSMSSGRLTAAITIHDHANNLKKKKKIWGGGVESWGFCGGGRLFLWPHPKWETALSVENFHLVIFYDTALLPGVLEKQSCDPKRDFHGIVRSLTWR